MVLLEHQLQCFLRMAVVEFHRLFRCHIHFIRERLFQLDESYDTIINKGNELWADAFARCAFGAVELPIGIVTAFIGAPFFMFLMIRSGYGGEKA